MNAAERPGGASIWAIAFPLPGGALMFATIIAGGVAVWDLYINGVVSRRWQFLVIAIAILTVVIGSTLLFRRLSLTESQNTKSGI